MIALGAGPDTGVRRQGEVDVHWVGAGAFGWPGVAARVREAPGRLAGVPWALARAARALQGFDRLVAHWAVPCAVPCALFTGAPLEVWLHGGDVRLLAGRPWLARAVGRALVRRDAALVFVASQLRSALLAAVDPPLAQALARRSRIEPAPIEVPTRDDLPRLPEVGDGPYAVWVGRMVPSKAPALAVQACREARLPLVMVGDGPAAPPAAPGLTQLGLRPRREALRAIAHATLLISTSSEEGAPTVVREARALGVPVVALPAGDLVAWAARDEGIWICRERELAARLVALRSGCEAGPHGPQKTERP